MNARRLSRAQRWTAFTLILLIPVALTAIVTSVLGGAVDRTDQVPALIVNNDRMVNTTNEDGTTSPVLAGRLIVTALTGEDSPGFSWSLANDESATAALKRGDAYAVITIPSDFSASIASLSSAEPKQASITLTTDDAHSYLAGSLAQALGEAMTSTLGQSITEQYLAGLFGKLGTFGTSMSSAASGAQQVAGGVAKLHDGLVTFSTGMSEAAGGATNAAAGVEQYVNGVNQYTQGVDSLASGLSTLSAQAQGVNQLIAGCIAYSITVAQCADPSSGTTLQQAVAGVTGGVSQLSGGANQLAAGSDQLRSGGTTMSNGIWSLANGMDALADGAEQSANGAGELATGAQSLATGLSEGANQFAGASGSPEETAKVVSQPVTMTTTIEHQLESVRDLIALLIIPAALWLGALAIFVSRNPFPRSALQSTDGSFAIIRRVASRSLGLGAIQVGFALIAAILVGVTWPAIGYGALFAIVASFAFIALHLLFCLIWPRSGNIVSILVLIVQLIALPGILPAQMLPEWMQSLSAMMPLTWAMNGMQAIVAGANPNTAILAAVNLGLLGIAVLAVTTLILSRRRVRSALGFALTSAS